MIPYGRGAQAIALQVKAETGSQTPVQELKAELDQMMSTWKKTTYPDAWRYMEECAAAVTNPGYLTNVWGRKREFPWPPVRDKAIISKLGREAQNLPIQSTVADTCLITLWMMKRYRAQHGLGFRIINQIHDAILVEAPEAEVDATRQMFKDTMGNISIPVPGRAALRLDIDIDVMTRWGEKQKKAK